MYRTNPEEARLHDIENLPNMKQEFETKNKLNTPADIQLYTNVLNDVINNQEWTAESFAKFAAKYRKERKIVINKKKLLNAYFMLLESGKISANKSLHQTLLGKKVRSHSGVLVITVFTSPYPVVNGKKSTFSCAWDCHYCPNEPDQPRSYLLKEPGVLRANQEGFDPIKQTYSRLKSLEAMGHPMDKLEFLILGGTWESYHIQYRENFVRDLYYAANTYYQTGVKREASTLLSERIANQNAQLKIIGITIETRPDTIDPKMIRHLRNIGCTRVQIGIQHTDDFILAKINRRATIKDAIDAIYLLKNCGFKIDVHLMPNLPYSSPERDIHMFEQMLTDPELQVDQWKIYPCEVVPWTKIKEWYDNGTYAPYSTAELIDVIISAKQQVHPWIRLNRVIRDIPCDYILDNVNNPSLRDTIQREMRKRGLECHCIRCREVKLQTINPENVKLTRHEYESSFGKEYYLSFTSNDEKILYSHLRLRIPDPDFSINSIFPDLPPSHNIAWIRELHTYGKLKPITTSGDSNSQHIGFGKKLLAEAENITAEYGITNMIVIAGDGTVGYYRKNGFKLLGEKAGYYMIKRLQTPNSADNFPWKTILSIFITTFVSSYFLYNYFA